MPAVAAAFLLVPVVEIVVAVLVARWIGVLPMLLALLLVSLAGAVVLRFASRRAWRAVRESIDAGRMPAREVADGAMTLSGGLLLLVPGFVTGLVGLLLVLPPTRALFRLAFTAWVGRRVALVTMAGPPRAGGTRTVYGPGVSWRVQPPTAPPPSDVVRGEVIEGEVVEDDDAARRKGPEPPAVQPPPT